MDGHKQTWLRLVSTMIVAIAVAIVWALALSWAGYFCTTLVPTDRTYESLEVMRDGAPLIRTQTNFNPMEMTYRTLDGAPAKNGAEERSVPGTSFSAPIEPPGLFETAVPWEQRIAGFTDSQRPPTCWFLVRDTEPVGRACFTGFDQATKLPIGYIGRGGFSRSRPARDQWFDIGRSRIAWGNNSVATSVSFNPAQKVFSYSYNNEDAHVPVWLVFVVDGDRVVVVDLAARTVRSVYESAGLMGVALLYEVPPKVVAKGAAVAEPAKAVETAPAASDAEDMKALVTRVAVRTQKQITIFNWPTNEKRQFVVPETMRDQDLTVNLLPSGELLVMWSKDDRKTTTVSWLRPDGAVAREREVSLMNNYGEDEQATAWYAAGVVPVPLGWAAVLGVFAPLDAIQSNRAASYGEAVAKAFGPGLLPLVAVAVCSLLLAWQTRRLQRKYFRAASNLWVVFVFLLGVPGFLAYLIEHRRAKVEACGACGKIVPRDRRACAACEKEFAAPPRIGTEIFA